jgi:signal transduction histidine kinase
VATRISSSIQSVGTSVAAMASPANRQKLWYGIWSGYAIALGFGVLALAAAGLQITEWRWAFVWLVGAKVATNSVAWLGLARDRLVLSTQVVNTSADVVLLTAAIYFTGGPTSPVIATYVIVIVVLSLLSNAGITLLAAALIVVAFAAMVVLEACGVLAPVSFLGAPGHAPSAAFAAVSIGYCALVVGIPAWFSTATLRLLRAKEADLEQRTAQLISAATQRSQFVASMTHELRTPIHGVQGLADLIATGVYGPVTEKQSHAAASIKRSAQNLLSLVDDVLALTRAEAGRIDAHPGAVDVAQLVERVTASVSWMVGTKRLSLEVEVSGGLPDVKSDERWLAHVLVNLVANAVKFTPEGGVIRVSAVVRGEAVVLSVIDTGIGIATEHRAQIFEPFRQGEHGDTRGYGGAGLGLALVARLTDLLGADVELDSTPGKGSTFRVVVPIDWKGRTTTQLLRPPRPPSIAG